MWHEARKQEKKIRGMLVDYRKRAERRQDFYERIKADPTQFLQVHGRKCKINLDASVATAAENPAIMMPWQGQKENLIDRFDVRAHLDYIPPVPRTEPTDAPTEQADDTERSMNYERFRVLAQNEFLGIVEEKYLHQLHLEEQFGVNAQVEAETKAASAASKKKSAAGAAIGYTYEETDTVVAGSSGTGGSSMAGSSSSSVPFAQSITAIEKSADSAPAAGTSGAASSSARYDECMKDESDSDLDMDVSIDINKIGTAQAHELNACGRQYGMKSNDFYSFLTKDADEADALRMAREEEQEKIMFSGRKSRRERRAQRERKFAGRPLSPPSYAAKEELLPRTLVETNDSSRSPSPINSGKITYITSFGGEDELQAHGKVSFGFSRDMSTLGGIAAGTSKAARLRAEAAGGAAGGGALSYAEKVKQNLEKLKAQQPKESDKKPPVQYQRSAETGRGRRGRGSSRRSSSSGSSRSRPRRSRGRRSSRSSSSSSSNSSSSSSPASRKRGTGSERRPQRARTEKPGNRSRSPARVGGPCARSGGRHATHSRYRKRSRSSASRSRSVSRSRSRSRTRGRSARRRSPRAARVRKGHARRSSSSTSRSSRSRSRTPAGRRQRTPISRAPGGDGSPDGSHEKPRAPTAGVPQERKVATLPTVVPSPILTVLPPPPPPPLPPASAGASLSTAASAAVVDEKKPIPSLALLEPEPEVPIKRYYGRRRGDESSSDASSTSDGDRDTNGAAADERKPGAPQPLPVHDPPWGDGDDGTSGTAPPGSSKLASGFTDTMVQIKQEKPDSSTGPTTAGCAAGASLRFGKTVPGGTSAPESKAGIVTGAAPASKPCSSVNPRDRLKRKMQILLNKQYKADKKAEIEKVERQIQQQQERDDEMRELALKLRRRQRELRHKYGTPESDHSKSHSSDGDRSTGDEDEATGGGHVKQQPPPRFGHSSTAREGSRSPQRQPLLSSPLASVAAPRLTRPPPPLRVESLSAVPGYRNSAVIERKPVLRSATDSGASPQVPPVTMYSGPGGDVGRLRRRNSPAIGGATGYRTQQSAPVSSHSMSLRRGAGGGADTGGGGGGPGGPGHRPAAPPGGGRFDDRNRRRSPPSRYNRSRSKSRERMPSARDTSTGPGRGRGGRRTEYAGRSRDYDRPHGYAGGGGGGGGGSHSGFSASSGGGGGGGRYRGGRRSRSGSRGRRSRSPSRRSGSPARGRGNGGGGGALVGGGTSSSKSGSTSTASRQTEPRAVKKLVDY